MQPSPMAPRAKTAASLSFQAASSVVDKLACGNSKCEKIHLIQELLHREVVPKRIHFDPTCTKNLFFNRYTKFIENKNRQQSKYMGYIHLYQ